MNSTVKRFWIVCHADGKTSGRYSGFIKCPTEAEAKELAQRLAIQENKPHVWLEAKGAYGPAFPPVEMLELED